MFTASISVDLSDTTPVNRKLLGNNIQWKDNADEILDPTSNTYYNNNIFPLLLEIPTSILRYPGGTLADAYVWENGIGTSRGTSPVDPDNVLTVETIEVGTEEFLKLCHDLKSEPLITVNTLSQDETHASDWVDYVNGRCKYWEIGNEPYLDAGFGYTSQTASEYALIAETFINAMKSIDPDIMVGIPLRNDQFAGGSYVIPGGNLGWNNTVLQDLHDNDVDIDYLSIHNAYLPYHTSGGTPSDSDFFLSLMAGTNAIQIDLNTTRSQVNSIFTDIVLPFAITEYNSFFMGAPPADEYIESLTSGLYIADFLIMCSKRSDILMANYWSLTGNWYFGMISNTYVKRTSYHVFDMIDSFFQGQNVSLTTTVSNFTNPAVGIIPSYSNNPLISVGCTATIVGNDIKVSYLIVNKSPTDDCNLTISYSNKSLPNKQTIGEIASISAIELYDSDYLSKTATPQDLEVSSNNNPLQITIKRNSLVRLDIRYKQDTDLIVRIGPNSNVAGITPDYNTLIEWWEDTRTPKNLVGLQKKCIVELLPGVQDFGNNAFSMTSATTNSQYYYHIKAYGDYKFKGLFLDDIPTITHTNGNSQDNFFTCDVDYTVLEGFIIEGTGYLNFVMLLICNPDNLITVDSIGIQNITNSMKYDGCFFMQMSNCIIKNCVINNIVLENSISMIPIIGIFVAFAINSINSCCHNNLIANISMTYTGSLYDMILVLIQNDIDSATTPCIIANNAFYAMVLDNNSGGDANCLNFLSLDSGSVYTNNAHDSTVIPLGGDGNISITPSNEFVAVGPSNINPHLKLTTNTLKTAGAIISDIVKPTSMSSIVYNSATTSPFYDIDGDIVEVFPCGVDMPSAFDINYTEDFIIEFDEPNYRLPLYDISYGNVNNPTNLNIETNKPSVIINNVRRAK